MSLIRFKATYRQFVGTHVRPIALQNVKREMRQGQEGGRQAVASMKMLQKSALETLHRWYAPRPNVHGVDLNLLQFMPRNELRQVAEIGCPVPSIENKNKETTELIASAKRLRRFLNVSEAGVCKRCPLKERCSFKNRDHVGAPSQEAQLLDASKILMAIHEQVGGHEPSSFDEDSTDTIEEEVSIEQTDAAFTTDQLESATTITNAMIALFDDLVSRNGVVYKQILQEKISEAKAIQKVEEESDAVKKKEEEEGQIEMLQAQLGVLMQQQASAKNRAARRKFKALVDLENVKLQALLNKEGERGLVSATQDEAHGAWGLVQVRRNKRKSRNQLSLQGHDPSKLQVFNRATNSFVDLELYEQALQPDKRNPNIPEEAKNQKKYTQSLSKNQKLHSINNKALTERFSESTPKTATLRRQKEIATSKQEQREFIEENRPALEAIMEAKRVQTYFQDIQESDQPMGNELSTGADGQNTDEKVRSFVHEIKRKKEVEKVAIGWDRVLSKNEVLQSEDHSVLLSRKQVSQMAVQGLDGGQGQVDYKYRNMMLVDSELQEHYKRNERKSLASQSEDPQDIKAIRRRLGTQEIVTRSAEIRELGEKLIDDVSIERRQSGRQLQDYQSPAEPFTDQDDAKTSTHQLVNWQRFQKTGVDDLEELQRSPHHLKPVSSRRRSKKSPTPTSPPGDSFIISKAKNLDNIPAKAQNKQKLKALDGLFDDRYIAENYYRGFQDDEALLYEKDGTISKLLQFDYKVHKLIKDPKKLAAKYDRIKEQEKQKAEPSEDQNTVEINV